LIEVVESDLIEHSTDVIRVVADMAAGEAVRMFEQIHRTVGGRLRFRGGPCCRCFRDEHGRKVRAGRAKASGISQGGGRESHCGLLVSGESETPNPKHQTPKNSKLQIPMLFYSENKI